MVELANKPGTNSKRRCKVCLGIDQTKSCGGSQCYSAVLTLLQCSVTVLQCSSYSVTVQFYSVSVIVPFYSVTVLQCYNFTVL